MGSDQIIGFGGGCHWCAEAVFQSLRGLSQVEQGFIMALPPYDSPSEAVRISFDPATIPLRALIAAHLSTHASTSEHSLRGKYRSAIYVKTEAQRVACQDIITELQPSFERPIITKILPLVSFEPSDQQFLDYYKTDPERPFCRTYIDPKLAKLRREFADYYLAPSGT